MGQYYMSSKSEHAKNEWLFYSGGKNIVVDMVYVKDMVRKRKKEVHIIVVIFSFWSKVFLSLCLRP